MNRIDYRDQFRESAEDYEKTTQSRHIRLIYELEKQVLLKLLADMDSRKKACMDLACGTGRWTEILQEHFKETIGVDVSEQMVSLAKQKCQKAEFIVTDITGDDADNRLQGREFDVITAFRFYKNAQEQLREQVTEAIPEYLKKNGLFIFDLHLNTFSFMGILAGIIRFFKLQRPLGIGELTVRTISLNDIKNLFKQSPFEVIDYYGMGVLPGRTNYTLLPKKLLYKIESFFTTHKILRNFSYNILVVAKKK